MKVSVLIFLLSVSATVFGQSKIDSALCKKLSAMRAADQKWRIEWYKLSKHQHSDYKLETIEQNMAHTDSINIIAIKRIFMKYGYPGYSLVGEAGSNQFWTIVQHCDNDVNFQQKVLIAMSKEVKRHNASGRDYAYLKDRVLVNQNHKQLYGTQLQLNAKTKLYEPLPIQEPLKVDARRKAVGLEPLSEYVKENNSSN